MKLGGVLLGVVLALVAHGLVLTFGGIFFMSDEEETAKTLEVELVAPEEVAEEKKKEDEKQPDPVETKEDVRQDQEEPPPDAEELLRSLELSAVNAGPALEAASLSQIEQVLNGAGGGGDFNSGFTFSSGGMIGATGMGKALDQKMEEAFNAADIDQQPRVMMQTSPVYPSELRGKKIEGDVVLIFIVDDAGRVSSPKVLKSTHAAFDKPALDAVKQWKFEPGLKAGKRVSTRMRCSVKFPAS
jgi:protein TonB